MEPSAANGAANIGDDIDYHFQNEQDCNDQQVLLNEIKGDDEMQKKLCGSAWFGKRIWRQKWGIQFSGGKLTTRLTVLKILPVISA